MRLAVDWDGTVTVRDSLVQVIHAFGDPALLAELEPRVGVDLTLHEEIALEFVAITAPLDEVVAWVLERVEAREEGWRVVFRDESACPACGEPCKRGSLAGEGYLYVGDGYSDRCAALAAERVFARDALARHLEGLGVPYEPFDDLRDVVAALAS